MHKYLYLITIVTSLTFAQDIDDSLWLQKPIVQVSGGIDVYYVYDFNKPIGNSRQIFVFNHNRHNEFNVNLAFAKLEISHPKYHSKIAIQGGTYVHDNYTDESDLIKLFSEANIGVSLNKKNNLWLEAGIFSSHIGFESAISSDNWTLTRSILAEKSPYFYSGAKITYKRKKSEFSVLTMSGWQRIQRLNNNSLPAFGYQWKLLFSKKHLLNWSTFVGTDDPDFSRRMRYFSNMYGQFQLTSKLGVIAGFDIGMQQKFKHSKTYDLWFSPVVIGQYAFAKKWKTALRVEYYQDAFGVLIPTNTPSGFKTGGISWNLDYAPAPLLLLRFETRYLSSPNAILQNNHTSNLIFATSMALKF
jgi:hypothetical protein